MTDWWIDGFIGWSVGWLIDLNSCCAYITGDKQYTVYKVKHVPYLPAIRPQRRTPNFDIS